MFDELVAKMTDPDYRIENEFDIEALMIAGFAEPKEAVDGRVEGYRWTPQAFLFVATLCRLSNC